MPGMTAGAENKFESPLDSEPVQEEIIVNQDHKHFSEEQLLETAADGENNSISEKNRDAEKKRLVKQKKHKKGEAAQLKSKNKKNKAERSRQRGRKQEKGALFASETLPIMINCEDVNYHNDSGDFTAFGNVKIHQGDETVLTEKAVGNAKTGDVWLKDGGTMKSGGNIVDASWVHYNFDTESGELKQIKGRNLKDIYTAPHAYIKDGRMVMDEGGMVTRCHAVKHPHCVEARADKITIIPNDRIIAENMKVFVKGKKVYSRKLWVNNLQKSKSSIFPRLGYKSKSKGAYFKIDYDYAIGNPMAEHPTVFSTRQIYYSKAHYKPAFKITHFERNYNVSVADSWDFDGDDKFGSWLHKKGEVEFNYKRHRIADGLPLSYTASASTGIWKYRNRSYKSRHTEAAVYLDHDRIHLFNDNKTYLDLQIGRRLVHEGHSGETVNSDLYRATIGHKISPKFNVWETYYKENKTSNLFDYGQPDMAKELRTGVQWRPDAKNIITVVNRYDEGKHRVYETRYEWKHIFCCWGLAIAYRDKNYDNSHEWELDYDLLYW